MTDQDLLTPDARRRGLRAVIVSGTTAKAADYVLGLVAPFLVLQDDGSAAGAIFVVALRGIPYLVSPVLGAVIDHFDRRAVYILSQLGQALCLTVAMVFHDRYAVVGTAMLLSGFGAVTSSLTSQFVILPLLSGAEDRDRLVSLYSSAIEVAKVAGLLVAAVLTQLTSPQVGIGLVAGAYFLAAAVSTLLPRLSSPRTDDSPFRDLLVGFRWLAKADVGFLVGTSMLANLGLGAAAPALVVILAEQGMEASTVSVALAASFLAGAAGSYLSPRLLPGSRLAVRLLVADTAMLASFVVLTSTHSALVIVVAFSVHSFALGLGNVISILYRQASIPLEVAGRVNSVIRMAITGAVPLSGIIYAAAAATGLWIWAPGLALACLSVLLWAGYTFIIDTREPLHVE